jgi:CBS domain containing-hemolysin-like protein
VDDIKGLVYVKDLVKASPETKLVQMLKPALFVPKTTNLTSCWKKSNQPKYMPALL